MGGFRNLGGMGEAAAAPSAAPAADFYDEFGIYPYQVTLSANEERLDQSVLTDSDSDFYWIKIQGTKTGNYEVRFKLPSGRYVSSARLRDANVVGTAQFPTTVWPPVHVKAKGRIGLDIKDLTGASNTIEILFVGYRRFAGSRR